MPILSDKTLKEWCNKVSNPSERIITPFIENQVRHADDGQKIISYGLSSYGYDARADTKFKIFTNIHCSVIDPKNFVPRNFIEVETDVCTIPPNSFALGSTIEYFKIPRDVTALCVGKSTYARCGVIVNVTPLEPGWEGNVTLEFSNTTNLPVKIYANEGVCQFIFLKGDSVCDVSYADRKGKYMFQKGITLPRT
jgi:dCTP deaminase